MTEMPLAMLNMEIPEMIRRGGYTMIPLLGASVLLVAIVIERLISLRRSRVLPDRIVRLIEEANSSATLDNLRSEAAELNAPIARIICTGFANSDCSRTDLEEAVTHAGKEAARRLEAGLIVLDTIAVACPLLGLLGTLLGMMDVFNGIQAGAAFTPEAGAGIAKALVTTIVGLIIAIPSLAFYNYLVRRVEELVLLLERQAGIFVAKISPSEDH